MSSPPRFTRSPVAALVAALVPALSLLFGSPAHAHQASAAFLDLRPAGNTVVVRWDIALRDLDQVLDLDRNRDGMLDWGEIEQQHPAIRNYAAQFLDLTTADGPCRQAALTQELARRETGPYAVLRWRAHCPALASDIGVGYRLLMDIDPTHQVMVSVHGSDVRLLTLRPSAAVHAISLDGSREGFAGTTVPGPEGFFVDGFRHILHGLDHLAFLLGLLLPALALSAANPRPLRSALADLLAVVSVFTLAHSLALGLTSLDLIAMPSRLVESLVALSVVVTGVQGLAAGLTPAFRPVAAAHPRAPGRGGTVPAWLVFAFGLIHGIGFGAALGHAGFGGRSAVSAILGFNLGVEAGQIAVLAVVFPLAWMLKAAPLFRFVLLPAAALSITLAGCMWLLVRGFDVEFASRLVAGSG